VYASNIKPNLGCERLCVQLRHLYSLHQLSSTGKMIRCSIIGGAQQIGSMHARTTTRDDHAQSDHLPFSTVNSRVCRREDICESGIIRYLAVATICKRGAPWVLGSEYAAARVVARA
jgi:hypothetical protein